MRIGAMGISFPHPHGVFCVRMVAPFYTICDFETPFLYERDGKLVKGRRGDILIMEPGSVVYHGPRRDAADGFVNDWVQVHGNQLRTLLERYPLPLNTAFGVGRTHFLRGYMERLMEEFHSSSPGRDEMIPCILTEMVIELHRAYSQIHAQPAPYRSIGTVRSAITRDPGRVWQLRDMAKISGYSPSRFSELYHKLYGLSPMQDLLHKRIALAKQLLASGQASVTYVAEACGFQSVNYFCKYFKKTVGCTPSHYIHTAALDPSTPNSAVNERSQNYGEEDPV